MFRNLLMLIGLFVFILAASGCRAGGAQQFSQQGFGQPQIGSQILQGFQQPIIGGNGLQVGGGLPTAQQSQQALGNFGRNLGSRFSNGLINVGVNRLINVLL